MVKNVVMTSYSPNVMINLTFKVEHRNFNCELEMMLIYCREDDKWVLDTCDYGGMLRIEIDGKILSDEDMKDYLKFIDRVGLPYEDECIDEVDNTIKFWSQEEIHKFIMKEVKI